MNRDTINYLRKFVGHKVVRTKRTARTGDGSYTDTVLILRGFTEKGEVIIQYAEGTFERRCFGPVEEVLPIEFTDRNWKLYSRVRKVPDSELNKWRGKKIRRTTPTIGGDRSYMREPVKLIAASRYHLIIEYTEAMGWLQGTQQLLRYEFANPKEWELAE